MTVMVKSHKRSLDRAVAELAARQHGVVARAQLAGIGLGRGAIELRVARGRLHRVHPRRVRGRPHRPHRRGSVDGCRARRRGGRGAESQVGSCPLGHPAVRARGSRRHHRATAASSTGSAIPPLLPTHRRGDRRRTASPSPPFHARLFDLAAVVSPRQLNGPSTRLRSAGSGIRSPWTTCSTGIRVAPAPRRSGTSSRCTRRSASRAASWRTSSSRFSTARACPRPATNVPMQVGGGLDRGGLRLARAAADRRARRPCHPRHEVRLRERPGPRPRPRRSRLARDAGSPGASSTMSPRHSPATCGRL